jgi:hypothetical protein
MDSLKRLITVALSLCFLLLSFKISSEKNSEGERSFLPSKAALTGQQMCHRVLLQDAAEGF